MEYSENQELNYPLSIGNISFINRNKTRQSHRLNFNGINGHKSNTYDRQRKSYDSRNNVNKLSDLNRRFQPQLHPNITRKNNSISISRNSVNYSGLKSNMSGISNILRKDFSSASSQDRLPGGVYPYSTPRDSTMPTSGVHPSSSDISPVLLQDNLFDKIRNDINAKKCEKRRTNIALLARLELAKMNVGMGDKVSSPVRMFK